MLTDNDGRTFKHSESTTTFQSKSKTISQNQKLKSFKSLSRSWSKLFKDSASKFENEHHQDSCLIATTCNIPVAIWKRIFEFLDAKSITRAGQTAKELHAISQHGDVWKYLCWKDNIDVDPNLTLMLWDESKGDKGKWWNLVYIHGTRKKSRFIQGQPNKLLIPA